MIVRVQRCWNGQRILFRLLVCGGLRVRPNNPKETWDRKVAAEALDLLAVELPHVPRQRIRFKHEW